MNTLNSTELFLRFVTGGSLIVLISLLSKTKYPILSGMFVLFPAVSLAGFYFLGQTVSSLELQNITKISIISLSATFVFLLVFYYTHEKQTVNQALFSATLAWFVAGGIIVGVMR